MKWALVGRNRGKLEAVRARLFSASPEAPLPDLVEADAADRAALTSVAESARVVITTVGPYALHGEPLVAACAAAGTDYVDLTGEPEFVDRMWIAHHAEAQRTGARLVHCCGFDSIPHDLGAYFTVQQLPEGVPLKVNGYVRSGASFSGGTYHSAINAFARARQTVGAAKERRRGEPRPVGREVHSASPGIRRDDEFGGRMVPLPTIDRRHRPPLRRRPRPLWAELHLRPSHGRQAPGHGRGAGGGRGDPRPAGAAAADPQAAAEAQIPGEGPDEAERAKSWFKVKFVGEGGGKRVVTEVSGGDPGYGETSKMLAESGLCLAFDELPRAPAR